MIKRIYDKLTGRFIRGDFDFDEATESAFYGNIPSGFYWPKYDGTIWVESLTQAEIDAIKANASPIGPTIEERLETVESDVDAVIEVLAYIEGVTI